MHAKRITMREAVVSIVAHNRNPFTVKAAFELDHKSEHLVTLEFKRNTRGILIIKETAKFDGSQKDPRMVRLSQV